MGQCSRAPTFWGLQSAWTRTLYAIWSSDYLRGSEIRYSPWAMTCTRCHAVVFLSVVGSESEACIECHDMGGHCWPAFHTDLTSNMQKILLAVWFLHWAVAPSEF